MADQEQANEREIAELKAEIADLKDKQRSGGTASRWGRGTLAVVLLVIAGILAPVAVVAVGSNRLVNDTDRYVQTISPLAEDPAMQAVITDRIVAEFDKNVNVEDLANQLLTQLGSNGPLDGRLANRLQSFTGPLADGVNNFVHDQVAKIVASPQFAQAWDEANKVAHQQLVNVLTGKDTDKVNIDEKSGTVSINLGPFIDTVKQQLVSQGFGLASSIPAVDVSIVLFQSDDLAGAQKGVRLLDTLAWVLPILVLLLLLGGIFVSPSRRRGVLGAGIAIGVGMLVGYVALMTGREFYLDAIPSDVLPPDAAANAFDTLTRFLRQGLATLLFFGVVVAIVALLAGPSNTSRAIRDGWTGSLARFHQWLRSYGLPTQSIAPWVERYALVLRILVAALAVAVFVAWSYPTPKVAIWLTVFVVVGLAVIDFLRAPAAADAPAAKEPVAT